jgi:hypothetical protein
MHEPIREISDYFCNNDNTRRRKTLNNANLNVKIEYEEKLEEWKKNAYTQNV